MFTARDMHAKRQEANKCNGIDEWLENTLFQKFNQYGNVAVVYHSELQNKKWTRKGFEQELNLRGFSVEYKSDQRDGDYYRISYPPQER